MSAKSRIYQVSRLASLAFAGCLIFGCLVASCSLTDYLRCNRDEDCSAECQTAECLSGGECTQRQAVADGTACFGGTCQGGTCVLSTGGTGGTGGSGGGGGCDPATIYGRAMDENAQTIQGMLVAANPSSDEQATTTAVTDDEGDYSMEVCDQQTYEMSAQVVVGSRYMTTNGGDEVVVGDMEDVEYNIDAKRGYFLDATLQDGTLVVTPDETVELTINYRAWSREGCPVCSYRIVVGFEGDYAGHAELGNGSYQETSGGRVGEAVISVTTPSIVGEYGIYAALNAGTAEEGEDLYESRFPDERRYIPLGILTVGE